MTHAHCATQLLHLWIHLIDKACPGQLVEEALAEAGEQQRSLAAEAAAFRRDAAATAARREAAAAVLRRLEAEGAMVAAAAGALRDKQAGLQARAPEHRMQVLEVRDVLSAHGLHS